MLLNKHVALIGFFLLLSGIGFAQIEKDDPIDIDYSNPKEYVIGGTSVRGAVTLDPNIVAHISGLARNKRIKIPGDDVSRAIESIWRQRIYSNVEIMVTGVRADTVFLLIQLQERAKLSKYSIRGLSKTETKNVRDEISLKRGQIITENLIDKTRKEIEAYYFEKGFYNANVDIDAAEDTSIFNSKMLRIHVKKGRRG